MNTNKQRYMNDNNVTYFDNFRVEHIPKEIKNFIGNRNVTANFFRIQAYDGKCSNEDENKIKEGKPTEILKIIIFLKSI